MPLNQKVSGAATAAANGAAQNRAAAARVKKNLFFYDQIGFGLVARDGEGFTRETSGWAVCEARTGVCLWSTGWEQRENVLLAGGQEIGKAETLVELSALLRKNETMPLLVRMFYLICRMQAVSSGCAGEKIISTQKRNGHGKCQ